MQAKIESVAASAYAIPTDAPESDGTASWNQTALVVVEVVAGGKTGLGYTYDGAASARVVSDQLAGVPKGRDAFDIPGTHAAMAWGLRNLGRPGVASAALSAVDVALWDLKAKLLGLPLVKLLGAARDAAPVYGSGGFTSYTEARLRQQLGDWADQGIPRVKMKVGTDPDADPFRVQAARAAIGEGIELFVDANGAYSRKQALALAQHFAEFGVSWFEEPVSSDDLAGLNVVRAAAPPGMEIAAGEYGFTPWYFRAMLEAGAVDVLQADATRCGGISAFLGVAALCEAFHLPLSAHCAPALHLHPCLAAAGDFRHMEYFHDHVRIESMLFDGAGTPVDGELRADLSRPGIGLEFKRQDAARYEF